MVKATGSPSGIAETANAIAIKKTSLPGMPRDKATIARNTHPKTYTTLICFEKRSIRVIKGVLVTGAWRMDLAIRPISVQSPVATTIPEARPTITVVPA